jgi:hypothetical protein
VPTQMPRSSPRRSVLAALLAIAAMECGAASLASGAMQSPATQRRVTLQLERVSLTEALAALARESGVGLTSRGPVPNVEVECALTNIEFRAAVHRLLAKYSYLLIERARADRSRAAQFELLFLGPDSGTDLEVAQAGQSATATAGPSEARVEELAERAERADSPQERSAALDALAYRTMNSDETGVAAQALNRALNDPDERVRHQALVTIKDTVDRVPVDALSHLVRADVSPDVRIQALELLVERTSDHGLASLQAALADSTLIVQRRARELAEEWHVDL